VARRLSQGIDFVRVDLYDLDDRVVFGEMTLYPASGRGGFDPPSFGRAVGDMWRLPPLRVLKGNGGRHVPLAVARV